jgi:rhodanese-related sulfurtransferase
MATPPRSTALTHPEVAELLRLPQPSSVQRNTALTNTALSELPSSPAWSYLDVRTPEEFATGHVPGAYNVPYQLGDLAGLHPNPDFSRVVAATFPVDAPLIVGCRSGGRAAAAERVLRQAGYTELRVHLGSLAGARDAFGRVKPGWLQAGYAVAQAALPGRSHADLATADPRAKPTPAQP